MTPATQLPTVLVVEDEVVLRIHAADIATDAGFTVVEAGSAAEAIRILESDPSIGIVFSDIHMPGAMDGVALAHAVRDRWPPVRLLLVSGHRRVEVDDMPGESRFIPKPYGPDEIVRALHDLTRDWRRQTRH